MSVEFEREPECTHRAEFSRNAATCITTNADTCTQAEANLEVEPWGILDADHRPTVTGLVRVRYHTSRAKMHFCLRQSR